MPLSTISRAAATMPPTPVPRVNSTMLFASFPDPTQNSPNAAAFARPIEHTLTIVPIAMISDLEAMQGRWQQVYYERDGVLVGVVGGGMPGKVMKARAKIASGAPISDILG